MAAPQKNSKNYTTNLPPSSKKEHQRFSYNPNQKYFCWSRSSLRWAAFPTDYSESRRKLIFSTNSVIDIDVHQVMAHKCQKRIPSIHAIYQSLFSSISSEVKNKGWKFIFTDGSKSKYNTSFAVTLEDGYILNIGMLPQYASIFTAEAFAILQATKSITKTTTQT